MMATAKNQSKKGIGARSDVPKKQEVKSNLKARKRFRLIVYIVFMLAWVGASMIASQLLVGITMSLILGSEALSQPLYITLYSAFSYILMLILVVGVPVGYYLKTNPMNKIKDKAGDRTKPKLKSERRRIVLHKVKNTMGLRGLPTWTDIGLSIVGFFASLLLAIVFVAFFNMFPWFNASETQDVGFSQYMVGIDRIIAFVALVVIAPIAEELVFRGWLYGKLREKTSREVSNLASILISTICVSLLFGLMHFQWNVGVNVFAMSLILCGLREITGTIYAGILMHMIKNGVAFYFLYVLGI